MALTTEEMYGIKSGQENNFDASVEKVREAGKVIAQMNRQSDHLEHIWKLILDIEEALDPILERQDVGVKEGDESKKDLGVPLANRLLDHNTRLSACLERLENLRRRIDL